MRYLIAGQSSADTVHRLAQTLEASSRLGTAHEDLALWLGRMETELASGEGQGPPLSTSDRDKVGDAGLRALPLPVTTAGDGGVGSGG